MLYSTKIVVVIRLKEIYTKIIEDLEPSKYTLYCDMDGVLCDFEQQFRNLTRSKNRTSGMSPNEYKTKYSTNSFWKIIDRTGTKFWADMPWMPDGETLYNYIKPNLYSLLSSPSFDVSSEEGKQEWVDKNATGTNLILAPRANKQDYAKENAILIDDLKPTIDEWNAQGGIGILHTSAASTIKQLKELGL